MRTLEEIRKANRREFSPLSKEDNTAVQLTQEQFERGRKQYEEFVKPISQCVFARQLTKVDL